jgi:hypothetical protein
MRINQTCSALSIQNVRVDNWGFLGSVTTHQRGAAFFVRLQSVTNRGGDTIRNAPPAERVADEAVHSIEKPLLLHTLEPCPSAAHGNRCYVIIALSNVRSYQLTSGEVSESEPLSRAAVSCTYRSPN